MMRYLKVLGIVALLLCATLAIFFTAFPDVEASEPTPPDYVGKVNAGTASVGLEVRAEVNGVVYGVDSTKDQAGAT